jgi:hypothetical protein
MARGVRHNVSDWLAHRKKRNPNVRVFLCALACASRHFVLGLRLVFGFRELSTPCTGRARLELSNKPPTIEHDKSAITHQSFAVQIYIMECDLCTRRHILLVLVHVLCEMGSSLMTWLEGNMHLKPHTCDNPSRKSSLMKLAPGPVNGSAQK